MTRAAVRTTGRPAARVVTRPVFGGATIDPNVAALKTVFQPGDAGGIYAPWVASTLFQDSAGTTAYSESGNPIGLVLDQSGNNNDIFQSTTPSRPAGDETQGFIALKEDGLDDSLSGGLGFDLGIGTYVAAVLFRDNDDATAFPLRIGGGGPSDYLRLVGLSAARIRVDVRSDTLGYANVSTATVTSYGTSPVVVEGVLRATGSNHEVSINGGTPGLVASTWDSGTSGAASFVFPHANSGGPTYCGGAIVIDREPSPAERTTIREALAAAAGITLP